MIKTHLESVCVSFRAIPQTNFFASMVSEATLIFFLENQEIFANVILSLFASNNLEHNVDLCQDEG